nr:hypothetical protein [Oscillatoria sp. Prado101]
IDQSKSLADMAEEAGVESAEIKEAAVAAGADAKAVDRLFDSKENSKMVMPKVELPASLKKAEQVTALAHPRWGQVFLQTYSRFKTLLEAEDWQNPELQKLVCSYLEDSQINAFIWHRLALQYPTQLEKVLREVLGRPDFTLERDLQELLKECNKPDEPELPEIASVPVHLHDLFLEALTEVNKSQYPPVGQAGRLSLPNLSLLKFICARLLSAFALNIIFLCATCLFLIFHVLIKIQGAAGVREPHWHFHRISASACSRCVRF